MGTTLHTAIIQNLPPGRRSLPAQRASAVYPRVPAVMVWWVAAITLAVLANRWIDLESGVHLMLVWLSLWAVVGMSFLLLAGTLQRMAHRAQSSWMRWTQGRADAADWRLAMRDHRMSADLAVLQHRSTHQAVETGAFNAGPSAPLTKTLRP